ncbi:MAG: hypothetical protein M3322_09685, partial [Actinomycetota bacterium]|nr:hypothetical protein [Actinomycetota bacterium]
EDSRKGAAACPPAWLAGWQKLANRIDAAVYCPRWMPNPLDGDIGGSWSDIESVDRDRSYLISFLWHEAGAAGGDVHVNFRGYPGRRRIPTCVDVNTVAGVTRRRNVPCFSDYQGERRLGRLRVGVYTVNQDSDQWHILYAWRRNGSLYTVSQHVARPLTYRKVVQSLDRIVRDLVLVVPRKAARA